LNASVAKLKTDVAALLAADAATQPAIDSAQASIDTFDAAVVAAVPVAPAPAA